MIFSFERVFVVCWLNGGERVEIPNHEIPNPKKIPNPKLQIPKGRDCVASHGLEDRCPPAAGNPKLYQSSLKGIKTRASVLECGTPVPLWNYYISEREMVLLERFQKYYSRFMKSISHATTQRAQRNPCGAGAPVAVVASLREAAVSSKML